MSEDPSPWMARALHVAATARGRTSPNPWVGAVLVRDGHEVAAGVTEPPGGAHAEAAALATAGARANGCDLYVTLEPCATFPGKRTPPCAEAVIAAGVRRVVVGMEDPDPKVTGRGIAQLRAAGIDVEVGDGRAEATALLRPYLKHRRTGIPYVIAKFAASLDGRTSTVTGDSKWITGEAARARGHEQRAWVDAIMAGSGTVLADDPELTARPGGHLAERQPVRVIVDGRGRTPASARLLSAPGKTVIVTTAASGPAWKEAIVAAGAQLIECERDAAGVNLDQLLRTLAARGIMSIWAEGGATVLGSLFDGGHVDEVWAFLAPRIIGGAGPGAVAGEGVRLVAEAATIERPEVEVLGTDVLIRGVLKPDRVWTQRE